MKEIVGAKIGSIITNKREAIAAAVELGTVTEFLDRERMQFMASFDLGRSWELMANGPTFFCIDDNGKLHPPPNPTFERTANNARSNHEQY